MTSHQWTRSARARSLTLAAALFAALGVLSLFVARAEAVPLTGSANPLPGSSFEGGDANQQASAPKLDWANAPFIDHAPDPNANDNIFAGGAEGKENSPGNWNFATQDGGSTPGKNNILDAYSEVEPNTNDVFLHLAFTRGNDTGTTYMAFELNKRADLWNNGKVNIPCRTTGDIIVSYQVSGNSPDVILQKWTSTTSDAVSGCGKTGTLTDYTAVVNNVNAQGAVNAAPIQNFLASSYPWPGNVIPAKLFGEASLNLTSLLSGALGTPCFSFGSIWMHTRASTSDSSNLDDYIAPRPLLVRNCSASGTKFHDLDGDGVKDAGEPGLAGFRMWADYNNDGVRDAGEPFADTGANGDYLITNIQDPSGTYSIREQLTAGAGTGGWTCSYPATTGSGGAFPCAYTGINGGTTPNVTGKDFGNYKAAVVKVEKQTVPDGAAGAFPFTSTIPGKASFALSDGGVETTTVAPGTYTATETPHPDFDLTGIACTDSDSTGAGQTATFRAQSGETITCTFTNTRKTGKLTVRKVLDPADDPGKFDLRIGNDLVVDDGGNLAAGSRTLPTGTGYTVSEEGGIDTSLAKYTSQIECRDGQAVVKSGSGTSLSGVPVIEGHDVVCTFTNARRPGTIEVVKDLVPNDDGGTFDLKVGDAVVKAGASDGDGGATTVAPGAYTVAEAGAGGTSLAKYDAAIECKDGDTVVASGSGTSLGGVAVDSGQKVVCTITNQRRPGKLTVVKDLLPATDGGRFDLRVGGDVVKAGAGDGDSGSKQLAPGDYDVAELAADGTSLAKYDASIACDNGQSGSGSSLAAVHVDSNDHITCTITNTRRKGSITVIKELLPANDGGTFDLKVGDQVVKAAAGDGDQGTANVAPGTYAVSETGAAGYDSAVACRKNGAPYKSGAGTSLGGLDVDSDDAVVCTITNVRLGSVTVTKTEGGEDPAGTWTFRLTGGPDAVSITKDTAADGTLAFGELKPGAYRLCEIDLPAGWHSSLGPVVGGEACVDLEIEPGEAEAVAVDNTMPAVLVIKEGNAFVHHGDTITYTFDVSNAGNTPLKDVSVEDDRCDAAPVRDAANDKNDDGDALLEAGEVWRFTCAKVVSDHAGDEENPIRNVATAHAFDQADNEVTAEDRHDTTIIHPGIAVNKELRRVGDGGYLDGDTGDAPLAVHRGDTIQYRFTVTNTGDTWLTVAFSDPKCDAQPAGPDAGDADADGKLDTGETWTYHCSHLVTDADADPLDNTVTVTGTDRLGGDKGTVTDSDTERADIVHPDIAIDKQVRRLGQGDFVDEGLQAHVGETLEYRFTVTDGDSDTPVADVELTDPRCDAGTLAGPVKSGGDADELLEDEETWTYTCTHVIADTDPNPLPNTATATGHDTVGCPDVEQAGDCGEVEDEDSTTVRIINPKTLVVKEGNQFAYPGDTVTFTFAVTNAGDTPLHDVTVTDDRCAPVTGPTEKRGGNADDLLDPGETWMFTCAKQIPADHKIGDENPIRNVATATGKDPLDKPVTSTDDHLVRVLHPAIDIEKTGPAKAAVGAPLGYTLTVTNPGDVPFAAQDVAVVDPRCEAPPAGPATGADPTPGQLDPGDTWTYTCTAQTTGQPAGTFVNTATVTGKDFNGRTVTDTDDFPTVLEAEQGVLPEEIVSGFARLHGPSGCVKQAFKATVRGRRIASVTFYVDGTKRKRIVAKSGQRVFRVKVRPGSAVGVHRVTARVVFKVSSRTKARTLRLSYRRCVRQVVTPQFTG